MPHSLRVRLGRMLRKGEISQNDYDRLCKGLDYEKQIEAAIEEVQAKAKDIEENVNTDIADGIKVALMIFSKHLGR